MSGCDFKFANLNEVVSECLAKLNEVYVILNNERDLSSGRVSSSQFDIILMGWSYGGVVASLLAEKIAADEYTGSRLLNVKCVVTFDPPLRARKKAVEYSVDEGNSRANIDSSHSETDEIFPNDADSEARLRADRHFISCTSLLKKFHERPNNKQSPVNKSPYLYIFPEESAFTSGEASAAEMTSGLVVSKMSPGNHWTMLFGQNANFAAGIVSTFFRDNSILDF
jgi:thioesterase domain-containing protein